jgi:ribose transport system permease protein
MKSENNKKSIKKTNGHNDSTLKSFLANPATKALLALIFILLIGIFFNADGAFFKFGTHRDTFRQLSIYGILACGMTMVIISGGIDLSVGSNTGLIAVLFAIFAIHWDWSPWLAIPACLAIGGFAGFISGILISRFKLQPFIATMAMMTFARGFARYITNGKKISTYVETTGGDVLIKELPKIFSQIDKKILGGNLNVVSVIFFVVFIISTLLLARHKWGRDIYAIGGNEEAARLSGVPVIRSKTLIYLYMGILSAIAGICFAAQTTQGDPAAATGYETTAIAMSVIGGTSMAGGRGNMGLTFLGILTIAYLQKVLSINAVPEALREMTTGAIIVIAVLAQRKKD